MDTLDIVELIEKKKNGHALATVAKQKETLPRGLVRAPREKWCSSLDPKSLQCLLAILENSVIPQLIGGYSPAAVTPLPPCEALG